MHLTNTIVSCLLISVTTAWSIPSSSRVPPNNPLELNNTAASNSTHPHANNAHGSFNSTDEGPKFNRSRRIAARSYIPPGPPSTPFANETLTPYNRTRPEHGHPAEGQFNDTEGPRFNGTDGPDFNDTDHPRLGGTDHPHFDGSDYPASNKTDHPHFDGEDGQYSNGTEDPHWNETEHRHWNGTDGPPSNSTEGPNVDDSHSWGHWTHSGHFDRRSSSQVIKCPKGSTPRAGDIAQPEKFNYVACCKDKIYNSLSGSLSADGTLQCETPPRTGDILGGVMSATLGDPEPNPHCLADYYVCRDKGFERACCKPVIGA